MRQAVLHTVRISIIRSTLRSLAEQSRRSSSNILRATPASLPSARMVRGEGPQRVSPFASNVVFRREARVLLSV